MRGERELTLYQRAHLKELGIKTVEDLRDCLAWQKKNGYPCPDCDAIAEKLGLAQGQ